LCVARGDRTAGATMDARRHLGASLQGGGSGREVELAGGRARSHEVLCEGAQIGQQGTEAMDRQVVLAPLSSSSTFRPPRQGPGECSQNRAACPDHNSLCCRNLSREASAKFGLTRVAGWSRVCPSPSTEALTRGDR
jgi:hypothetical protein